MTEPNSPSTATDCPVCGSGEVAEFVSLLDVPVYCNVLWATRDQAVRAPRGDMRLGFCRDCTHIFNTTFDPALITYTEDYENSLHFSARFRAYADSLVARLIERYGLRDKLVLEIGCGKGDFLKLLCERGGNRGIGFDPGLEGPEGSQTVAGPITFTQGLYAERHADLAPDLICCRQVLEHLEAPRDLLGTIRNAVRGRPGTAVFFEVPNALFTLRDMGIWDLIYEHVSYFTPASLARAFALADFEVEDLREAYDGQYLCLEASARGAAAKPGAARGDPNGVADLVADFAAEYRRRVEGWQARLAELARSGRRAAIWGAGSKGVAFLNAVKAGEAVGWVVDISPRKHGLHVAGTGHRIVAPETLRAERPDMVIVMNPIYRDEIERSARDLGVEAEFVCV